MGNTNTKECSRCGRYYMYKSYLDCAWHTEEIKYCLGEGLPNTVEVERS